jgi:ParB/RepB/Spo0J family partition protein
MDQLRDAFPVKYEDVVILDVRTVVPSDFTNRHSASYTGAAYKELYESVKTTGGNETPIVVRPLPRQSNDLLQQYEIVVGHRRVKACAELKIPVRAVIRDLSDEELFAQMNRENAKRASPSAWEAGLSFKSAMAIKNWNAETTAELAGCDASHVSRCLAIAGLPDPLVDPLVGVVGPTELSFRQGERLVRAIAFNRDLILARAKKIRERANPLRDKRSNKKVIEELLAGMESLTARVCQGSVVRFSFVLTDTETADLSELLNMFRDGCERGKGASYKITHPRKSTQEQQTSVEEPVDQLVAGNTAAGPDETLLETSPPKVTVPFIADTEPDSVIPY